MNKPIENNKSFLKESFKEGISAHHKKYLGTDVPDNYFSKSKISILDNIKEEVKKEEKPKKQFVFWMQPQFKYIAAASLVFILSLTVWLQSSNKNNFDIPIKLEEFAFSDDILINSLLIEDSEIDAFADATLFNEVLVKAELFEQEIDNVILNSLILEDSLLDNYIDDEFLKTIIL
ncbi:hypothetical protein [uncultured Polaribacter sp.]|uniref:hypothetical protein n=1 Tax=uncultured Polaribacter sp. TaxID=174711 RepID=UPI00261F3468|nr:hypothetical protein [uncultured Polaribacter sp.]